MFKEFQGKHVTITGGAGFVGSNLAIRLVELGAYVTILDSMEESCGGNEFNLDPIKNVVEFFTADIANEELVPKILAKTDFIFNCAGKTSHIESIEHPETDFRLNFESQFKFLNFCRKYCPGTRIVYAGTRQIYGLPEYLPLDEKHPVNPIDINGINKFAAGRYHVLYNRFYKIPATVIRLTNTFGPRQLIRHNRYGVTGWFINRTITGNPITIFNGGVLKRDFNFVDDVVNAFLQTALQDNTIGKVYILGGKAQSKLKEFAEALIEVNGSGTIESKTLPDDLKSIDIGDSYSSYAFINSEIGWEPETSLREGIRKTLDFYKEHKEHYLD